MKVRIRFSKYGALRFIGHLDVMRYFQKAIRRAGIPIAYSEGFSPHQVMSFAAPLSVGHTSQGEYLDIELAALPEENVSVVNPSDENPSVKAASAGRGLRDALQAVMVDGISILDVQLLTPGEKNAMASVAAASYLVFFRQGTVLPQGWQEKLSAFYGQEDIPVVKKAKKSERQINLKESIYQLKVMEDICKEVENIFIDREEVLKDGVYMLLNASSGGNIKPAFVLECFFRTIGYELPDFALMVHRLETYKNTGNPYAEGGLVPLIWEK